MKAKAKVRPLPYADFEEAREMMRFLLRLLEADDAMAGDADDDAAYLALVQEVEDWLAARPWAKEFAGEPKDAP